MNLLDVFSHRRVLITGGMGFIGSTLARRLLELDADVVIVDSLIPEYGGNRFNLEGVERIRVRVSDVRDASSIRALVSDADYLFNLAGQTSHLDSMRDPVTDLDINCRAQLTILEACREQNPGVRIVFASTRQIYGRPERLPVDETHVLRPVDVNGINKMAGERYHLLYSEVYDLAATALRLTNTYGPRMRVKDARQTFLGVWISAVLQGAPFEVWGGDQLRDFNYVDDAVDAFLMAAADERAIGRVFNLGSKEVVTLAQLAEIVLEVAGGGTYEVREFPKERKRIDIGDYYADISSIERDLGWEPRIGLRDGLSRTIDFYRSHLSRYL